jgi:hypothetical protein
LEFSLGNKESNVEVAYIGRGKMSKTLAQMLFDKCDYLQSHKYEECEQCYRYDICRNAVNKEKKER